MQDLECNGLSVGTAGGGFRPLAGLRRVSPSARTLSGIVTHGPFDTSTAEGRSRERLRRIILTAVTSALARAVAMATPLITVRLVLGYLGRETYGLWVTITAFFSLFAFADLGLGSGLHTTLSQTHGAGDVAASRRLTSTASVLVLLASTALALLFGLAYPFVPWARVLHAVSPEATGLVAALVAAAVLPQVANLPLAMVQRTQMALQDGFRSNLWQCVASLTSLGVVVLCVHGRVSAVALVFAVSAVGTVVMLANWCWYFLRQHPELRPRWSAYRRETADRLLRTGGAFLCLAVFTTAGLGLDNLIVAHFCGLEEVATFSVAARVAALLSLAGAMLCTPLWAPNGEALAQGEVDWVRRNTARMAVLSAAVALGGGVLLVAAGPRLFALWLGRSMVVGRALLLGLAVRELCLAVASPYFMVLNGAGSILAQVRMFAIFTPICLAVKIGAVHLFGMSGIPWAMAVCYGTLVLPWVARAAGRVCAHAPERAATAGLAAQVSGVGA